MAMEVYTKIMNNKALIKVEGKFNIDYIEHFDISIKDVFNQNPDVVAVDLEHIEYIDSSALGSLIKGMNIAKRKNIQFYLINMPQNIQDVFKLSYLDQFFQIKSGKDMEKLYPEMQFTNVFT